MNHIPPYAWTANGGYQPSARGVPYPAPPPFAYGPPAGGMFYGPFMPPPPMAVPILRMPLPGPPPPLGYAYPGPPPPFFPSPPPAARPAQPPIPDYRAGTGYLFPEAHTNVHLARVKELPKQKQFQWKKFQVDCSITVQELMKRLGFGKDGYIISEMVEVGGGNWTEGQSIPYKDDKAKKSLKDVGWTQGRGRGAEDGGMPPVWVYITGEEEKK